LGLQNDFAEQEESLIDLNQRHSEIEKKMMDLREKMSKIKVFQYEQMHCPDWMRIMIYEIIVAGAPPSGVDGIVRSVLKHVVPILKARMPHEKTIMNLRIEIGLVSDSMSAMVLARCKRIIQVGHDGTDVNGIAVLAANMVVELMNGDQTELMLRDASWRRERQPNSNMSPFSRHSSGSRIFSPSGERHALACIPNANTAGFQTRMGLT